MELAKVIELAMEIALCLMTILNGLLAITNWAFCVRWFADCEAARLVRSVPLSTDSTPPARGPMF